MAAGKVSPAAKAATGASASGTTGSSSHSIGMISLIAFAVGTMVGGGVFALSGMVVKDAGPGAIIAYILAGIVMLLSALSFAAVASRAQPGETGYAPIGRVLSPVWRFVTMWAFYIMGVTGVAYVLMSFGSYFLVFVPRSSAIIVAIIAGFALVLLNYGPAGLVGKAETVMVGFKLTVLLIFIVFGLKAFKPSFFDHWTPHGAGSVLAATALLFTAYSGFNVITNMSGSVKDAQKKVPRAIVLSLIIVAAVYIGVAVALVVSGTSSTSGFETHGLTIAAEKLMGHWGAVLVGIAALVSTLSGANANLLGSSDLLVRMAQTGDIPSGLGKLSKKGNPISAVTLSGIIILVLMVAAHLSGSGGLKLIVIFTNVSGIIALVIVDIAAAKMGFGKWATPGMKLKGGGLIPVLAVIAASFQIPSLGEWWKVLIGVAMVAFGFVIWGLRKNSNPADVQLINRHVAAMNTPLLRLMSGRPQGRTLEEAEKSMGIASKPAEETPASAEKASAPATKTPGPADKTQAQTGA